MDQLLSTRVQRNYGTDHVYLTNAELALIWEDITGKKTVTDRDIADLKNLIGLILRSVEIRINGTSDIGSIEQAHIDSDNHARVCDNLSCDCDITNGESN